MVDGEAQIRPATLDDVPAIRSLLAAHGDDTPATTVDIVVAGAAQLIAFAFDEVGGNRHVTPGWDQSCVQYPLDQATPQSVALYKSGVFEGNEPDADFLRSFFADPQIHLPAGTWDITAIASFSEGGCAAPTHMIKATVRIHVTG